MSRLAFSLSDRTELGERLALISRVLRLQSSVTWALRLLSVGLALDCLWLAGGRFLPYQVKPVLLLAAPAVLALVGAAGAALWRVSDRAVARRADRELGLKERLVTAVELRSVGARSPLAGLQVHDAVEQLRRYEPLESFPVRLPGREVNVLLILAVLAVGLVVAPNPMERTVRQREQVAVTIKQEAERINKLADELAAFDDPEDFADIDQALRAAASSIGDRQLSPDEANAALQRIEQQLLSHQDPSTGELEDALTSLAGSLASEASTRELGTSLARGDIRQAAREMRRLGEESTSMSPADRLKLSRSLRQAASRTSRANPALASALGQGSEALESGQGGNEAGGALSDAADQLDQASGRLRAASQRERALSQLQQSRGAINRANQAAQGRSTSGQRSPGQQPGAGLGDMDDGFSGPGGGQGQSDGDDMAGGSGAGTGSGSRNESIYDPLDSIARPDLVPGADDFDPNEAFNSAGLESPYGNEARVPYERVYAQYQERATQTLQNSYIPAGLKDIVKDYFSSLAPSK